LSAFDPASFLRETLTFDRRAALRSRGLSSPLNGALVSLLDLSFFTRRRPLAPLAFMEKFFPLAQRCFVTCFAVIAYSEYGLSQSESTLLPKSLEFGGKTDCEILWDQYGIPHIYGPDLLAVVRGYGYSQMENHAELVLQKTAEARGRTAEYFGPGTQNANVENDIRIQTYGIPERARRWYREGGYCFASRAGLDFTRFDYFRVNVISRLAAQIWLRTVYQRSRVSFCNS
jgi:hypothetical protein